jgi:hypothetical protein
VGVGTTSPSSNLHVAGTTSAVVSRVSATTATAYNIYANTGGNLYVGVDNSAGTFFGSAYARVIYSDGAYPLNFYTNGSERMRIAAGGNVGIATTSPNTNTRLQINGGGIGAYWTNGSDGAQIYIGSGGFDNSSYYNSAPGIGSVLDANTSTAGALALYVYAGVANSRTRALNLNANGNVALMGATVTTSGTGITFPATQSASSDANTLDDYEEGTWTPVSPSAGYTFSNATGTYTKIGRMVQLQVTVTFSAVPANNSNVLFSGVPFTVGPPNAGVVRDNTNTGALYMLYARTGETSLELNSMDGVGSGQQRTIRINESYSGTVVYSV